MSCCPMSYYINVMCVVTLGWVYRYWSSIFLVICLTIKIYYPFLQNVNCKYSLNFGFDILALLKSLIKLIIQVLDLN